MLKAYSQPIEAVIIDPDLRIFTTPGTREKIVMRMELDAEGRLPKP
jgi:hypothetical protein